MPFQLFAVFSFGSATVGPFCSPRRTETHTHEHAATRHTFTRTDRQMRPENRAGFCSANRWSEVVGAVLLIFANTQNHTFPAPRAKGNHVRIARHQPRPRWSTRALAEGWLLRGGWAGKPSANVAGHARTHTTHTRLVVEMHRFLAGPRSARQPRKRTAPYPRPTVKGASYAYYGLAVVVRPPPEVGSVRSCRVINLDWKANSARPPTVPRPS
ncbi:flagellar protein FlgJ [Anopheles sinensis]|uniref:Flagellar protein FlgJ n=1 Tax=Anopheles sinensis TaxID=74873 RepID=A0A084W5T7_ANOSI|nr:flagellar protein FlgJ [Anopheles sinensis]